MPYLLHLNGPPGIGKSTIARRYADEHPGVLNCDIDVLRSLIGGWSNDFPKAGTLIRPAALGMIEGYLASGQDVVLPQLLTDSTEISLFEGCAVRTDALRERHAALRALPDQRPDVMVIPSVEGAVEDTYRRLLASLAEQQPTLRPG
ncbi:AAA family ATPase [Nocardioides mesophilus]|uniref:Uncharacterized protein n=1 Tax=Nocardioides mesophilus TaxID=433659 RepID=A0A7G9RAV7_9ACTN|nr:AAA family ATPase [Nocardioides mesophilus]QNN52732.1 hypothetical protein H9L09_20205 [Nocardioides mesophilus]